MPATTDVFSVVNRSARSMLNKTTHTHIAGSLQQKSPAEKSAGSLVVVHEMFVRELEGYPSRITQRVPVIKRAAFFYTVATAYFHLVSR